MLKGRAFVFGKNIDTDQIYPGRYLELHEPANVAKHAMEGANPQFSKSVQQGDIIVAATNFGCGSSREHAAIAIKHSGVGVVIAESFARIFYRNCINLGVPLLVCPGISSKVNEGDSLTLDLTTGKVKNLTQGTALQGEALSAHAMVIIEAGGVKPMFKAKYGQE